MGGTPTKCWMNEQIKLLLSCPPTCSPSAWQPPYPVNEWHVCVWLRPGSPASPGWGWGVHLASGTGPAHKERRPRPVWGCGQWRAAVSRVPSPSPKDWAFLQDPTSPFLQRARRGASPPSCTLIQAGLLCDNPVLPNSERVPIQRNLASLFLTSSHETSKARSVHCLRFEVRIDGEESSG